MSRRLFTPSEVQELIPALELVFGRLIVLHAQREAVRRQPSTAGAEQLELVDRDIAGLEEHIHELGGELKDVEQGLVDFPCQRGDRIVLLCWRYGEKRLGFRHDEADGF